ncbi:hypothetical protein LVD17_28145 [Fulvivirga ulvae]|uniref:hypothetical protein n=1 Tax=Fulvivirga ulvae TaxID=2904245 RepID=UPI001F3C925A|nr:hypothetical protein [Fulvivirga ulvae]UII32160.1 hypothetical protein LVD17_28145 [Fulvivirga ulvae]
MKIGIIPTYEDIFGGNAPEFSALISGIPSVVIASVVSVINGELYLNQESIKSQGKILTFILRRQSNEVRQAIYKKIMQQYARKGSDGYYVFSTHLAIHLLHLSLHHYHEDAKFIDTTPEQELNIFKAYLVASSRVYGSANLALNTSSPDDFFRKNTWPLMIGQLLLNHPYNYFLAIVKSKCFFDALEFKAGHAKYVYSFVGRFNDTNSLSYILRFANTLQLAQQGTGNGQFKPFSIKADAYWISFYEDLCINLKKYSSDYPTVRSNFKGFREKPLIKIDENNYLIISWDFLSRKIYDGLIFDFYKRSGIKEEKKFNTFPSFKQYISQEAIEKYLFRKLVKGCFKKKHIVINFDDDKCDGHPDAYVRNAKKIFLFELKDAFFSAEAIDSENYDRIKAEIDKKYNTDKPKRKGTYQLVEQLHKLKTKPFENESYDELSIKTRNLVIYPIIVYTDPHFGLPGIAKYLQEGFENQLSGTDLKLQFKQIKPLSFIGIDFLISRLNQLQKKELSLDKIIDITIHELNKRNKQRFRKNAEDKTFALNDPFENLCSSYLERYKADGGFVKVLFSELELGKGLIK